MAVSISGVLDVLAANDIRPLEDDWEETDLPAIGELDDGETIYSTSIAEVFRRDDETAERPGILYGDDRRLREWWDEVERLIEEPNGGLARRVRSRILDTGSEPPEPHCAWYCPIHFFGHSWGIYIRESCILSHTIEIASFVNWGAVHVPKQEVARQLLRSAFYVFFLHEQFHHKVESLGFRFLIATGTDR